MIMEPYKILKITPEYSKEDAKSAYRNLIKIYHPDKPTGDVVKFREVQEAWRFLDSQGDKAFNHKVRKRTHKTLFTFRGL